MIRLQEWELDGVMELTDYIADTPLVAFQFSVAPIATKAGLTRVNETPPES